MSRPGISLFLVAVVLVASCELSLAAAAAASDKGLLAPPQHHAPRTGTDSPGGGTSARVAETLAELVSRIRPLSHAARIRHRIADATFCWPQNALGALFYAFLELIGGVVATVEGGGARLIATSLPFGLSLGTYVFVGETLLSDRVVSHELGHMAQSYRHGPFYLVLEGTASFVQAALSLVWPPFARGYLSRWPENEADALGNAILLPRSP